MNPETIVIRGAKEHNLKKIDITLPRCPGDIISHPIRHYWVKEEVKTISTENPLSVKQYNNNNE